MSEHKKDEKKEKTGKRKIPVGLLIVLSSVVAGVLVGLLVGFLIVRTRAATPQEFTKGEFSISLSSAFREDTEKSFENSWRYYSRDLAVGVSKWAIGEENKDLTAEAFCSSLIKGESSKTTEMNEEGLVGYARNYQDGDGEELACLRCVYKSGNAFYAVAFCCYEKDYNEMFDTLLSYAKSVKFGQNE